MRTALALLLIASLAHAEPPKDAPLNPFPEGRSIQLGVGEVVPFGPSLCLEATEAQRREWNAQRAVGELAQLKRDKGAAIVSVPVLVAIVAGSLAIGVAVGVGATLAVQRR